MRTPYSNELMHYGVMGMKWGVRRYQNPDGTLTAEGRRHLGRSASGNAHRVVAGIYNLNAKTYDKLGNKTLASMNKAAAKESLKKAEAADAKAQERRAAKIVADQPKKNQPGTIEEKSTKKNDPVKSVEKIAMNYVTKKLLDMVLPTKDVNSDRRKKYRENMTLGESITDSILYNSKNYRVRNSQIQLYRDYENREKAKEQAIIDYQKRYEYYSNPPKTYVEMQREAADQFNKSGSR